MNSAMERYTVAPGRSDRARGLAGCSTRSMVRLAGAVTAITAGGTADARQAATEDGNRVPDMADKRLISRSRPPTPESEAGRYFTDGRRGNAQYSAESLRGGTEAAAPAPSASAPAEQVAELAPPPAQTPAAQTPAANPPADVPADSTTPGTGTVTATTQPEAPAQPAAAPPPEDAAPSTGVPEPDQVATADPARAARTCSVSHNRSTCTATTSSATHGGSTSATGTCSAARGRSARAVRTRVLSRRCTSAGGATRAGCLG